jgi:5'-methylthioinosine phosphorylase
VSLALIGGTGLSSLDGLQLRRLHAVETPYGSPSMAVEEGEICGETLFFLHRHGGRGAPIPPHLVNYRANLWALKELGVSAVIGVNAVGAISKTLRPGRLVIPDQLIDYTWGREHSFDDGSRGELLHIDFTEPYDRPLRGAVLAAAVEVGLPHADTATLGVVQGPRLETAAEVVRLARDGCDLVGMTGMPEASLARELGLPYAAVCMVVNAAAGTGERPISMDSIRDILAGETRLLARLLEHLVKGFSEQDHLSG